MTQTSINPQTEAIQNQLDTLRWMIPDAQQRVVKAAEQMLWRAERAVADAKAMAIGQPGSLSWINFAAGDLREAQEAEAALQKLYEQQKLLQYLLNR